MALTRGLLLVAGALALGCAPPEAPHVPRVTLASAQGRAERFPSTLSQARWTVLVFSSPDCPCFRAHEPRLVELARDYRERGVRFLLVDSEVEGRETRAARLALERGLGIELVVDADATLASALGAEYATYSVVLDPAGVVRYRGGIDSDKSHLRADATPFLRDALDDLLSGQAPRRAEAEALGCVLQTR